MHEYIINHENQKNAFHIGIVNNQDAKSEGFVKIAFSFSSIVPIATPKVP